MHQWAEKTQQTDSTRVKELLDNLEIADFEKYKMVAVFKCPREKVADKLRTEFKAKGFPDEVIKAVTEAMDGLKHYHKLDSNFDHAGRTRQKGTSNLYQYAVWCKYDGEGLMDVSVWCITTKFKKGSAGAATKGEIDGLKMFMEQETRTDVLHLARKPQDSPGNLSPEESMINYAQDLYARHTGESVYEDDLINRMEITGFEKYYTNSSFRCERGGVVVKVQSELQAKKFPEEVITAVTQGLTDMTFYKKMDENFTVNAQDGRSNYYKFAIWSAADPGDNEMDVSLMGIAANFKKKSEGALTKSEVEVLGCYLGQEAVADVLKVHAPHILC